MRRPAFWQGAVAIFSRIIASSQIFVILNHFLSVLHNKNRTVGLTPTKKLKRIRSIRGS